MRSLIILVCLSLVSVTAVQAVPPAHYWSKRFGGTSADQGFAVVVDDAGNVLLTGTFAGTADFGGGPFVSAGGADMYLAKYNSNGLHQWSRALGGTSTEIPGGITVDDAGNVTITGQFNDTVDFGGGGGGLTSAGFGDIFLAQYSPTGVHRWSQRFGGTLADNGHAVTTDGANNVVLVGAFAGTADFGGGPLVASGTDVVIAKFTANGVHQWSSNYGGILTDQAFDVAVDGSGHIVVAGYFESTADFGGGAKVSNGGTDVFVAKYDATGAHQWSQNFGGTTNDFGRAVAVDNLGNVFLGGDFTGTASFGGVPLVSAGLADAFLAKYDATGAHLWSQRFGAANADVIQALNTNTTGAVFATGTFNLTVDFGGGGLISTGGNEIFATKHLGDGVHEWSRRFGSTLNDNGLALNVDSSGDVLFTGNYTGTVDFGGGSFVSFGALDVFLVKYGDYTPVNPDISAIVDVPNDQGRQVTVTFANSGLDNPGSPTTIVQYEVFFRNDPLAMAALPPADDAHPRISSAAMTPPEWVFVGAVPAHGDHVYTVFAPTTADSTIVSGQHLSAYFIRATTSNPFVYFDSGIATGYSVDNLAPSVPASLVYVAGDLTWDEPSDGDFDYFTVYGSNSPTFDGSAVPIDYTIGTAMDVSASPYVFYYLTATDFSGNESNAARANTLTGVGAPSARVLGINAYPNPFNPATTIRYDLPSRGRVVLSIYDARGTLVTTLVDETKDAGSYPVRWTGQDGRGIRVSSGVYFATIEFEGSRKTMKTVLLK